MKKYTKTATSNTPASTTPSTPSASTVSFSSSTTSTAPRTSTPPLPTTVLSLSEREKNREITALQNSINRKTIELNKVKEKQEALSDQIKDIESELKSKSLSDEEILDKEEAITKIKRNNIALGKQSKQLAEDISKEQEKLKALGYLTESEIKQIKEEQEEKERQQQEEEQEQQRLRKAHLEKELPKNLKQLNMTFSFTNSVGKIREVNNEAINLLREFKNIENELLTKKLEDEAPNNLKNINSKRGGAEYVSLNSLAREIDGKSYFFLVFDSEKMAPLQEIEDVVAASALNMTSRSPFYLTNDYTRTNPKNYAAIVELNKKSVIQDAISIAVGKTAQQTKELRQNSTQSTYGWIERGYETDKEGDSIDTDELRIILPYIVRKTPYVIRNLFGMNELDKSRLIPIVPQSIRLLVESVEGVIQTAINSNKQFLDNVDNAFSKNHVYSPPDEGGEHTYVQIDKGVGLYHYSGNVMFPRGSHTNLTSNNLMIDPEVIGEEQREMLLDFYQKHPAIDSFTLSTRPPLTASVNNGLTVARYVTTRQFSINKSIKRKNVEIEMINKIYNLFIFPGSHTNESFLMNLTELCGRINYDSRCEKCAMIVWSNVPRNKDGSYNFLQKISGDSQVDIITFHHQKNKEIADFHLWLFTAYDKDSYKEEDRLPPLLWEMDYATVYSNDLLRVTPYGTNPVVSVSAKTQTIGK